MRPSEVAMIKGTLSGGELLYPYRSWKRKDLRHFLVYW
jgi:hypothetical protein